MVLDALKYVKDLLYAVFHFILSCPKLLGKNMFIDYAILCNVLASCILCIIFYAFYYLVCLLYILHNLVFFCGKKMGGGIVFLRHYSLFIDGDLKAVYEQNINTKETGICTVFTFLRITWLEFNN